MKDMMLLVDGRLGTTSGLGGFACLACNRYDGCMRKVDMFLLAAVWRAMDRAIRDNEQWVYMGLQAAMCAATQAGLSGLVAALSGTPIDAKTVLAAWELQ